MVGKKPRVKRSRWDPNHIDNHDVHTWVHTAGASVVVRKTDPSDQYPMGGVLMAVNLAQGSILFPLTSYREDELRAMAYGIYKAFELALPICIAIDEDSKRRYDEGEEFQLRRYRSVPAILSVEGYEQGDDEGVSERPAPVALRYWGPIQRLRVRRGRSRLDNGQPGPVEAADDPPQDDGGA